MSGGSDERLWEVVGGVDKGGIVVRTGREFTSAEAPRRLSTGAVVRELEVVGERLRYLRVSGTGPDEGWVSIRLKDKPLLAQLDAASAVKASPPAAAAPTEPAATAAAVHAAPAAAPGPEAAASPADVAPPSGAAQEVADAAPCFVPRPAPVTGSRKLRVMCLHGTASSPGVLQRQLQLLIRELSAEVELVFHGGHLRCEPDDPIVGGQVKLLQPFFPNEVLTQYALPKGSAGPSGDPSREETWRSYDGLDDALDRIQESLRRHAPIDAVFGFSQGSNLATIVAAQAALGKGANLLCVVHSGTSLPGWKRDLPDLFGAPLPMPAMFIQGEQDVDSLDYVTPLYDAALVERHKHSSDHRPLPKDPQEAKAIAQQIRRFLLRHCRKGAAF